jgi:hypothetical protein
MLTSWFGECWHNSKWNQHVRLFQAQRALLPDEPFFVRIFSSDVQNRVTGLGSIPRLVSNRSNGSPRREAVHPRGKTSNRILGFTENLQDWICSNISIINIRQQVLVLPHNN